MSQTLETVRRLVANGESMLSEHAYDRIAENVIEAHEIEARAAGAVAIEDYPEAHRGPSVLALQNDSNGQPIHVVWGLRKGSTAPAVVVTVYRPDPLVWTYDFRRRR